MKMLDWSPRAILCYLTWLLVACAVGQVKESHVRQGVVDWKG